jgi:hypothetical protein
MAAFTGTAQDYRARGEGPVSARGVDEACLLWAGSGR